MEELDIASITKRSIHGVFALVSRTFIVQTISFGVNFLLFIYLSPVVIGTYFVVSAVIAFLQYFSDIGLAGALIQKKETVTQEDLKTTFTIQQLLVIIVCVIAFFITPLVSRFYTFTKAEMYLFEAMIFAFFLSSLKTIPSILLERDLRFEKLVIPQIVETLFFNITLLLCVLLGYGINSFTFAVLARGMSGLITIFIVSPWKIELGISKIIAKKLLSFGIPFQLNSFLALIKDDAIIAYIGKILAKDQLGFIDFAQTWAFIPLRLIMDNIIRITFPSFSRLQHDEKYLGIAIEKSLFVLSFLIFPALVGLTILFPYFIDLIPKYHKWQPALLSLTFFAINAGLSSISTPLTNALNAIGKIKVSLYFMIFWTIATWIVTPLFIHWFGFNGFASASAVIATSVVIVIFVTKKYIHFSIVKTTLIPFLAAVVMGFVVYFTSPIIITNVIGFTGEIILGAVVYLGSMYLLAKQQLLEDITVLRKQLIKA